MYNHCHTFSYKSINYKEAGPSGLCDNEIEINYQEANEMDYYAMEYEPLSELSSDIPDDADDDDQNRPSKDSGKDNDQNIDFDDSDEEEDDDYEEINFTSPEFDNDETKLSPNLNDDVSLDKSKFCHSHPRKKKIGISTISQFAACNKCHKLYDINEIINTTEIPTCSFVNYPNHSMQRFRQMCSNLLTRNIDTERKNETEALFDIYDSRIWEEFKDDNTEPFFTKEYANRVHWIDAKHGLVPAFYKFTIFCWHNLRRYL
ncbi:hypothetical protein RhiirA1_471804 [Rhizophagus irregularis]|uniref:Uncharacterized protein n=1 Tax=Rhizophagus irregularis TaxID=588596 RepID=A0A2N0R3K0_9GLOM|nr:hypothetical protein RhiirA1_471804 [Rhizophagus irregularis]